MKWRHEPILYPFIWGLTPVSVCVCLLFTSGWEHFSLLAFLLSMCWSWLVWCISGAGLSSPVMFPISKSSELLGLTRTHTHAHTYTCTHTRQKYYCKTIVYFPFLYNHRSIWLMFWFLFIRCSNFNHKTIYSSFLYFSFLFHFF